jgi:hypothetical protein
VVALPTKTFIKDHLRWLSFLFVHLRAPVERETRRLLKVVLGAAWGNIIPESNSLSPCFVHLFTL